MSSTNRRIIVIAHDLRSCHNVGSLLRTAEGLGVERVYLTGYTPYPLGLTNDDRMPHIANKLDKQIHKTALGAEALVDWHYEADGVAVVKRLMRDGVQVVALEQSKSAVPLQKFAPDDAVAVVIGNEVDGVDDGMLAAVSGCVEIPMFGQKESFNVVQAAAMALYRFRFA